jgi:hypothetical protein
MKRVDAGLLRNREQSLKEYAKQPNSASLAVLVRSDCPIRGGACYDLRLSVRRLLVLIMYYASHAMLSFGAFIMRYRVGV